MIVVDNGPEFAGRAAFASSSSSREGRYKTPFIENFNGRFRDECLTETCSST
jgi:hypothetical protein